MPESREAEAGSFSDRLHLDGGRWVLKGTHMTAAAVLEMISYGAAPERIVELCPHLRLADIRACCALGAALTRRPL